MDFTSSVWFQIGFENHGFGFCFGSVLKNCRFGFLYRSVVKCKKRVSCLSCVCILHFLNAQLVSNACFLKFNLNFNLNHIVYVHMMPIMPLSCVRNVKNVKAL